MLELRTGDLWDYRRMGYYVCITTNGMRNKDGSAVMGAGCAKEAQDEFPHFQWLLGGLLELYGNHVFYLGCRVFSFPTKADWRDNSKLPLIEQSAKELVGIMAKHPDKQVVIPRPGCGLGRLYWADVQQVIEPIFASDQFIIISKNA